MDRIKAFREGLRNKLFQPRFLSCYDKNSITFLKRKRILEMKYSGFFIIWQSEQLL